MEAVAILADLITLVDAVIAWSEATKQSILSFCCAMDCFAALAMTWRESHMPDFVGHVVKRGMPVDF
jgi:hypothetical protein